MTGQLFGDRYQIGETLGFGGMSEVHRARDLRLGRDVAVKELRADLARDPSFQNRFRREAQNAASLNHPAIVAVYDTGESKTDGGTIPYIVMEYVDGLTLRDMIRADGAMAPRRAMEIMADVCAALDFSHRHGIVHRDVKPANIMLTKNGAVKVMDFGIARAVNNDNSTQTATAAVIGTAQYLSPEQARGDAVDARSDVYSTGCVLYELLTGVPPFVGDSPVAIAYQHVREDAKAPSEVNPSVPTELDAIVLKALNKNALNRYQTAAEMRSDMVRALSGQAVLATPVMTDDERTELMRATPARMPAAGSLMAPPSRAAAADLVDEPDDDAARKKRMWGFVGVGALCLAILAAAIWVTISITKQPDKAEELPVPTVVGMTYDDAVAKLRDSGFSADSETVSVEVADDQVGKVQSQNPSEGTVRPITEKVKLTIGVAYSLVKVPNVIGMSQADASKAITDLHLNPVFVTQESAATEKDKAFDQDPRVGVDAKPGSTVTVKIGLGVKLIDIPDPATLVGQPLDAVNAALTGLGFAVIPQVTPSAKPLNEVLAISGATVGQPVQEGTLITVAYSDNSLFIIPNLSNRSENGATNALIDAGWGAGNAVTPFYAETADPALYDKVISQDPIAGTEYNKNGVVKVTLGVPKKITIPNLVGKTEAEARTALANAGHTGKIATVADTSRPDQTGKVIAQNPGDNAVVTANSTVTITVGAAAPPPSTAGATPGG